YDLLEGLERAVVHVRRGVLEVAQLRRVDERGPGGRSDVAAGRRRGAGAARVRRGRRGALVVVRPGVVGGGAVGAVEAHLRDGRVVGEVVGEQRAAVALDAAALAPEDLLARQGVPGELALVERRCGRVEGLDVGDERRDAGTGLRVAGRLRVVGRRRLANAAHEILHVAPDRPHDRPGQRPARAVPDVR